MRDQIVMPSPEGEMEFYNVGEEYTLYDTIAVTPDADTLSLTVPGWFATFAAAAGATIHSFFNVRNRGNCELAFCNLDARDQLSFAFQADSISLSFWGSGFSFFDTAVSPRYYLPNALWQGTLPFESSLTLRVQQDDKLKLNALMASPGYGPTGGGAGDLGGIAEAALVGSRSPIYTAQTQGIAIPSARIQFPNKINIPRRANIAAELNFTQYGRAVLAALPGPGTVTQYAPNPAETYDIPVMFGITCGIHGRRLVQQRGELHA